MTSKTFFAISLVAATALGGAAYADPDHGQFRGPSAGQGMATYQGGPGMMGGVGDMMQIMRMHGEMTGGMGPIGGMGPMGGSMMQMLDAGDDGSLTPEEAREQLQAKLVEYDADGNGTLSIAEFETLHSAMIRETMVDRFQSLDADGDGAVTKDEMSAPAEFMERMQQIRSQMNAGPQGQQQMGQGMDGNSMMKDN